jgi:hypothetical protein
LFSAALPLLQSYLFTSSDNPVNKALLKEVNYLLQYNDRQIKKYPCSAAKDAAKGYFFIL